MFRMIMIPLILTILPGAAAAGEAVSLVPLETGVPVLRYAGDCTVGNSDLSTAQGYYNNFFTGDESYAALIAPAAEGCACANGFKVQAVHMALNLTVATNIWGRALLYEAVEESPGCWAPGGPLATSAIYAMAPFVGAGVYDLEIPLSAPCATPGDRYFVVFQFVPLTTDVGVGVVVDDSPEACSTYDDRDLNWQDSVVDRGWVGNFFVWADVDCCEEPVAVEGRTWGGLKSLYR